MADETPAISRRSSLPPDFSRLLLDPRYVEVQSAAWQLLELEAEAEARLRRIRKQLLSRRELLRAPQGAQVCPPA